jgi:phosphoglycolate phosphatase
MVLTLRKIPAAQLRLVVFDLDGTLIDSRADLAASVNGMLRQFHRHELPEDVIASYIGDGAGMLVRRALGDPDDEALVREAEAFFLAYYREHKLDNTYVYSGCIEILQALYQGLHKRQIALLSNKPVGPCSAICEALGLAKFMFRIYGGDSFHTKKPDPAGLEALIREANVAPEETVMIGDSDIDVLTAQNVGAYSIGCSYGLSPHTLEIAPPDVLINKPADLIPLLAL